MPWYDDYFTADYWAYADAEYTPERTEAEVGYLAGVLRQHAPGRRVLDLGCGTGRHAIGLARLGFDVTGVDASGYALERAAQAAADAGVRLRLHRADLLGSPGWEIPPDWEPPADAAICVQAFGWGSDGDQLRMLRTIRRLLRPDGLLVLDHSSILAITRMYQPRAQAEIGGATFTFTREYDPVRGRSGGQVEVRRADGTHAVLPDDVRLYTPVEVRALLTRAGFDVTRVDAGFQPAAPVTIATRYVQFLARPARRVTSALAGHRDPVPPGRIDLRWAPDEAEFTRAAVASAWAQVADPLALSDLARRYDLSDPYGGARATPVLAVHLGWPAGTEPAPDRVSVGAGATGLLHGLARLADGGTVLIAPAGHPQLAEAAATAGAEVAVAGLDDPAAASAAVARIRPAVTVIDRPAMTGRHWSLPMVSELAASTARAGGVLVVDETCACYLPPGPRLRPGDSAAPLTDATPGLIVLRSVSKGYCCGGLRIGFAVASPDLAAAVRGVLAPLAGSALALDVALGLLRQPDPLGPLRTRIARVKPAIQEAMRRAGIEVIETDEHVPWIALRDDPAARAVLDRCGLAVKDVPVLPLTVPGPAGAGAAAAGLLRMSVPLSAPRREAVAAALALDVDVAAR